MPSSRSPPPLAASLLSDISSTHSTGSRRPRFNYAAMNNLETTHLVNDFINYRLKRAGLEWTQCPDLPQYPNTIRLTMRNLADSFEERFARDISQMLDEVSLTSETLYIEYIGVLEPLLNTVTDSSVNQFNWDKIVLTFSFSSAIAVKCALTPGLEHVINIIAMWLTLFIIDRLRPWIEGRGGWQDLVSSNRTRTHRPAPARTRSWPACRSQHSIDRTVVG